MKIAFNHSQSDSNPLQIANAIIKIKESPVKVTQS